MLLTLSVNDRGGIFMSKFVKQVNVEFDWEGELKEFLEWKKNNGVTKYLLDSMRRALTSFLREYPYCDINDLKGISKGIQAFLREKNAGYYNKQLQALSQFFEYLRLENELITENPCKGMKYRGEPLRIIDHEIKDILALLKKPNKTTFTGLRDYAFMILALDTGIRPYEAFQLRPSNISKTCVMIEEKVSKTRQPRILPISIQTFHAISRLISVRHATWDKDGYIFCSWSGERLDTRSLQIRFRKYSKSVGVTITPYHLRHVFALTFVRNGGDVFALQRIMGHSKLDMTRHYVNLVQTDIVNSHAKASPLAIFLNENHRVRNLVK
jgi:site-specific recombinase XerD